MCEPQFMLQLAEEGRGGVSAPDAVCGHRVQRELLTVEALETRAARLGRGFSCARLQPYRNRVRQARLFRKHPLLSRFYCFAVLAGRGSLRLVFALYPSQSTHIEKRCLAIERMAAYREYLRVAGQLDEYRVFANRSQQRQQG
jgi:hypothetical protein